MALLTSEQRLQKATVSLLRSNPFYATVALNLLWEQSPDVSSMETDGTRVLWNPVFVDTKTDSELKAVVAHEVLHVVLEHMLRQGAREQVRYNQAADLAVNSMLRSWPAFPPDGIMPGRGIYASLPVGRSAEWYYDHLPEEQPGDNSESQSGAQGGSSQEVPEPGQQSFPGDLGQVTQAPLEKAHELSGRIERIVAQAATSAREAGKLPGGLEELCDKWLNAPQVNLRAALRRFAKRTVNRGRTFRRPNRRSAWRSDLILPSKRSKTLGTAVFAVDTSGSMRADDMATALSELQGLAGAFRDLRIIVYQFDTKIQWRQEFHAAEFPIDPANWVWKGRGGTDYVELVNKVADDRPDCFVVLSDGCVKVWPEPISTPTLWLLIGNRKAPWGQTVNLEV